MKKGRFSAFPRIPPFGACSVGRLFAFSHTESCFRPLGWDASESVPHKPCFSVIYVGRCFRFSHRNSQNRGLMWDFTFSGLRRRAAAMWERRPAPAAQGMTGMMGLPDLAAPCCSAYSRYGVHESPHFLISRARQRPIASTGRQGNCHSACRASTECEAVQLRNAVCQTDTHSEAEGAS